MEMLEQLILAEVVEVVDLMKAEILLEVQGVQVLLYFECQHHNIQAQHQEVQLSQRVDQIQY
jgi:hypothetical protein